MYKRQLYPDVAVRWRGNTACVIRKRNFKLKFDRAQAFQGRRKINLNSLWTDKSLLREQLAWDFIGELGLPRVDTEHARLHINGCYHGLFFRLEHPDSRYLRNHGLDGRGSLYKAVQAPRPVVAGDPDPTIGVEQRSPGMYGRAWEEETNEGSDYSDIENFINSLHAGGGRPPPVEFFEQRTRPKMIVGFQVAQTVLHNLDSATKNHFLYHDFDADKWSILTWDMDLVLGKFFTAAAVNRDEGREVGTLNLSLIHI